MLDSRTQLDFLFKIYQARLFRATALRSFYMMQSRMSCVLMRASGCLQTSKVYGPQVKQPARRIVGWVAQQRVPVSVPDVSVSPHWFAVEDMVKSGLAVPVEHENEFRGVLFVASYDVRRFHRAGRAAGILFANQVAAAIELTRLFQAQAARQHELEICPRGESCLCFRSGPRNVDAIDSAICAAIGDGAKHVFSFSINRVYWNLAECIGQKTAAFVPPILRHARMG